MAYWQRGRSRTAFLYTAVRVAFGCGTPVSLSAVPESPTAAPQQDSDSYSYPSTHRLFGRGYCPRLAWRS